MTTRGITFRALKTDGSNEFVYGDLIQLDNQILIAGKDMWATEFSRGTVELKCEEIIPETLGQFCGLTDKNGTRVFEGDRLRYTNHLDENGQPYYVHHIVQFSHKFNGWFAKHEHNLNCDDTHGDIQLWVYVKNIDFEVIGNIHQK